MAAPTVTEIVQLGPCTVTKGGVSLGYISNANLELTFEHSDAMVGEFGSTPVKRFHLATNAVLKGVAHQLNHAAWAKLIPGSAVITDGSNSALGFGSSAGVELTGEEVVVTPVQSGMATTGLLTLWSCTPEGNKGVTWENKPQDLAFELRAMVNPSKNQGEKLGRLGHATVSADTTAPTITDGSCSPIDDATGVSVSAAKTIQWNEAMDESTIIDGNILCFLATETGIQARVAMTITHNPSTHVTSITPVANLTATTAYEFIFSTRIKNASGIAFAGAKRSFTTT